MIICWEELRGAAIHHPGVLLTPADQARNVRDPGSVGKRFQTRTRRWHLNGRGELVERCPVVRHVLLDSAVCPL